MKGSTMSRCSALTALLMLTLSATAQQPAPDAAARIKDIFDTANAAFKEKAFENARAGYAKILADAEAGLQQRIDAFNRTADAWRQENAFDKARGEYAKILAITNLNMNQRIDAFNRTAETWNSEGNTAEARKICEATLKLPDFPENQRRSVLERIAAGYILDGDVAKATETLAAMSPSINSDLHTSLDRLAESKLKTRDFSAALAGYAYLASVTNLNAGRRCSSVTGLLKARAGVEDSAQRRKAEQIAEQTLRQLIDLPATLPNDRLLYRLQLAAIPGLSGDLDGMEKALDEAMTTAGDILPPERLAIIQNANILFMAAREYETAKVMKARIDALIESSRALNVYPCRFMPEVPKGANNWAQSDFIKNPANANTRFFAYPSGEEDKLAADMGAIRPLSEKETEAAKGREVCLAMAYDTYAWHIFIRADEPDIEQIMVEEGRRGSSLEMFFAPGLKGEVYYQWIIGLAQGKVDIYHWNTHHRFYRYLENKVGSFQSETIVLPSGWGTAITIAWEALYDKLPFIEGNEDTWRFSTMRWGPASMTWGGTVHEPGRWGRIKWLPPTPAQLTEIQRHIIRKAWWRYQSCKDRLATFWQGERGDPAFYDYALAPFFAGQDSFTAPMKEVAQWDAKTVSDVFTRQVPLWMELDCLVEEWRADFLTRNLLE